MSETTQTTTARQSRKPERVCRLRITPTETILVLRTVRPRAGDLVDIYTLEPFAANGGRGLFLGKQDGSGQSYSVFLSGPDSLCDCKGFASHGHCKHVESLLALDAARKL
jgi:hypothetical protein